uniref:Uncharacterized protein n=1 Tax=Oryzias sinensis TaxID=183150 RepID=A0A8C7YDE6_9TELE
MIGVGFNPMIKALITFVPQLLHQAVMYEIDDAKRTCKKSPLKADFQPLKIPQNAFRISQTQVGSSSVPGQGLLVNNWSGKLPDKSGEEAHVGIRTSMISQYSETWSKVGDMLWMHFFDNVIGITNPNLLEPPEFCAGAVMDMEAEPRNYLILFYSAFLKEN